MSIRITEEQKSKALVEYAITGNMYKAALVAGVNRMTLYRESLRDNAFKKRMENAKGQYCDQLEAILDERIKDNGKGDKASALLLMFKLKAELPDKYRDRIDHKVEGNIKIITGVPRPTEQALG